MTDEKDIYECEISPPEAHGSAEAAEAASLAVSVELKDNG